MANPFRYSKARHTRTETPPQYSRYQQFKPHLQKEFAAQCVYCRALDHVKGYDAFGVDHYRPTSNPLFVSLATEYLNLYYACNRCNRLKRDFWPTPFDQSQGWFIPNPCEQVMFDHLRYQRGEVVAHSAAGAFTIRRLDLNCGDAVAYRESLITHLARTAADLAEANKMLSEAQRIERGADTPEKRAEAAQATRLAGEAIAASERLLEQSIGALALATARRP